MRSYKDIGTIPKEYEDETLLDKVVELVGQFKKPSAIAEILREDLPEIPFVIISILISRAKAKIRETLNVDPQEYRGQILECLMSIISGKAKHRERLRALEMLAEFTGVNHAANEDPGDYAQRVADAIKAMDASVDGTGKVEESNLEKV